MPALIYTQTQEVRFSLRRLVYNSDNKKCYINYVPHQVLNVGCPELSLWPAGESEGGVPAGAQQQCMIISLLLWSGFCRGLSGLWPLTSSHSQTTIPLCWRPNSPSISLLLIRPRPLLRSAADECFKTECRGEIGGEDESCWLERWNKYFND